MSIFNLFKNKKVECYHSYIIYNTVQSSLHSYLYYEYHFVCKKCKNVLKIDVLDIFSKLKEIKEWYNKGVVLGEIEKVPDAELTIPSHDRVLENCVGGAVRLLIEYYQVLGVDIFSISKSNDIYKENFYKGEIK